MRFHARVAGRVLGQVERELAAGDGPARAHAARLAALGFAVDAELAAAIRSGALDDRWAEVTAVVRATVADKLAVANPTYATTGTDGATPPLPRRTTAENARERWSGGRERHRASLRSSGSYRCGAAPSGPRPADESVAMTLAVTVVCQDGVVVAADSRTTLGNHRMLRVGSDFTHKVFDSGGVAVATYGEAFVDERSIASHMAEFAVVEAGNCDHPGPTARKLAAFFGDRYDARCAADDGPSDDCRRRPTWPPSGSWSAGYDDAGVGEAWEVTLPEPRRRADRHDDQRRRRGLARPVRRRHPHGARGRPRAARAPGGGQRDGR